MSELIDLIHATLQRWIADDAQVTTVITAPNVAQDHSGATVRFHRVSYTTRAGRAAIDVVTKDSLVYERQALALLHAQGHPHIPFSHTLDMSIRTPALLCQQHAGTRLPLAHHHIATVAQTLAGIHVSNCGAPHLPWMRRLTSQTFFLWWQPVWERACADSAFVQEFHAYLLPMQQAAQRFAHVLDQLWQEGDCATVLHTDLSAWHVLLQDDQPSLIDWEQARYGPLYLDLVNFFTLQTVSLYYAAIAHLGFSLSYTAFLTRYHAVWAFVGLKYMVPALLAWLDGEREASRAQLQLLLPRALATHAPER